MREILYLSIKTAGSAGGLLCPCKGLILAALVSAPKVCLSHADSATAKAVYFLLPFSGSPVNGSIYSFKLI